jgi:hypothetical protein
MEIGKMNRQGQLCSKASRTHQEYCKDKWRQQNHTKLAEWLKPEALSSNPSTTKKKISNRHLWGRAAITAKYLTQIIVMGVQIVDIAFAQALQQEFAAADAQGHTRHQFATVSKLSGLSHQEGLQAESWGGNRTTNTHLLRWMINPWVTSICSQKWSMQRNT